MSEILTHTRVMFDPVHPDPEKIRIRDIAHALSMLCRANGHFPTFYSVGQHCINCAEEAAARGYSARVQLGCLLHDGSEAYLSDVTRPVKKALPKYLEIEEPLQNAIWNKWLRNSLTTEEIERIFDELTKLAQDLTQEEKRYVREGFSSDEELSIFDLLFKSDLTKQEIATVKKVSIELLAKIKGKIAELDHWTDKVETKAIVSNLIRDTLYWDLPESYDDDTITSCRQVIYEYVYMRYKTAA